MQKNNNNKVNQPFPSTIENIHQHASKIEWNCIWNVNNDTAFWKPYVCDKDGVPNPASLKTINDLVGDVGVVHQARRNVDHWPVGSRAHAIHSTHSTMATLRTSTLRPVDFSLSNHTIGVLKQMKITPMEWSVMYIWQSFKTKKKHICINSTGTSNTSFTFNGLPLKLCLLTFSTAFFISSSVLNSTTLQGGE